MSFRNSGAANAGFGNAGNVSTGYRNGGSTNTGLASKPATQAFDAAASFGSLNARHKLEFWEFG